MSEFSQDQLYRLLEANEQQVHLLKKILRLLEGQTGRYQGDAPPAQTIELTRLPTALDLQDHP